MNRISFLGVSSKRPWAAVTTYRAQPRGATPRRKSGAEAARTSCPRGGGQEELPQVRDQGQRPRVPGCDNAGMAERSYPTSEVRGRSQEDPMPEGQWPRGVTPRPRSGAAAESARLRQRRSSRESYPMSKERWLLGCWRA